MLDAEWKKPDQILVELAAIVGKTEYVKYSHQHRMARTFMLLAINVSGSKYRKPRGKQSTILPTSVMQDEVAFVYVKCQGKYYVLAKSQFKMSNTNGKKRLNPKSIHFVHLIVKNNNAIFIRIYRTTIKSGHLCIISQVVKVINALREFCWPSTTLHAFNSFLLTPWLAVGVIEVTCSGYCSKQCSATLSKTTHDNPSITFTHLLRNICSS